MNMKVHWVYPALHTKNINIACIQGIPWVFFMVNSGNFMNLRHTGNSLGFFMAYTGCTLPYILKTLILLEYREFPGVFLWEILGISRI